MTVVILAGGLGTRIQAILGSRPKALAIVSGRPFLSYLFDQLISSQAHEVLLCTGHMAGMIFETFGSSYQSLRLKYSQEDHPLGTGGALRLALPHLTSDHVLVMNGDSFAKIGLSTYVQWFFQKARQAALLLTKVLDTSRYGTVLFAKDGEISSFEEKRLPSGTGWINAGIYILKTSLVEKIPSDRPTSLEVDFFPHLIGSGLYAYPCNAPFIDIGVPDSYALAERFFLGNSNRFCLGGQSCSRGVSKSCRGGEGS